jgi:multisubunit Na+/H+ antiporter MnhB subunit
MMAILVDLVLILALITLAWQAVRGRSLFRSIVMFVAFGLTMALAWARMRAPDLAMAEAAIGAGVTGALMMLAYRRLVQFNPDTPAASGHRHSLLALPVAVLATILVGVIGLAAISVEPEPGMAGVAVVDQLKDWQLGNPITGVLLLFRNLDTLLEIAVLLAAFLAARAVAGDQQKLPPLAVREQPALVGALLAIVLPLTVLVALHLLKAGSHEPGGAFQAGAVLAAAAVLLMLAGRVQPRASGGLLLRLGLSAGLISFSLIGLAALPLGAPLMALPGLWAIYLIEAAMMLSIALTLALLFAGGGGLSRTRS